MVDPVDPLADVGSPRYIRLRDGRVIPLTGAFGQELLQVAQNAGYTPPPETMGPAPPERGTFATPTPGRATIGQRFRDWMRTSSPAGAFDISPQPGFSTTPALTGVDIPYQQPVDQPQPDYSQTVPLSPEVSAARNAALIQQGIAKAQSDRQMELERRAASTLTPPMSAGMEPLPPSDEEMGRPRFAPAMTGALPPDDEAMQPRGALSQEIERTPSWWERFTQSYPMPPQGPQAISQEPTAPGKKKGYRGPEPAEPTPGFLSAGETPIPEAAPPAKKVKTNPAAAPGAAPRPAAGPITGEAPAAKGAPTTAGGAATAPTDYVKVFNDLYDKIKTDKNTDLSKEERNDLIMEFGLRLMAGGQQRGASLLGAVGEAGFGTMATRRGMKREKKAEARAEAALKLELTKHVTDLAEKSQRMALDQQKANNEMALGLRKGDIDLAQLEATKAHYRAVAANSAASNALAWANYNRLAEGDKIKANAEARQYKTMLYRNNQTIISSTLPGQTPITPLMSAEAVDTETAKTNPMAEESMLWQQRAREGLNEFINGGGWTRNPEAKTQKEREDALDAAIKQLNEINAIWWWTDKEGKDQRRGLGDLLPAAGGENEEE